MIPFFVKKLTAVLLLVAMWCVPVHVAYGYAQSSVVAGAECACCLDVSEDALPDQNPAPQTDSCDHDECCPDAAAPDALVVSQRSPSRTGYASSGADGYLPMVYLAIFVPPES